MSRQEKTVAVLVVDNSGDESVGISGFEFKVEISEKYDFFNDVETAEEFIAFMKQKLLEFCEVYDGRTVVHTQEELDALIDYETARLENLNEG